MSEEMIQCSSKDLDDIWDLTSYAYGIPQSSRERVMERFEIVVKEHYIYKVDDIAVAMTRLLPFEQNIRGTLKPMIGIGGVASSPEHRRQGYVRKLMIKSLEAMHSKGYATSALYPFKDTFYMALGYTKMPMSRILEVDPRNLSGVTMPEGYSVQREEKEDAIKVWREIHEEMVEQTHGAVRRNDERWKERTHSFRTNIVIARNPEGTPEGVMTYGIKGYGEGHSWSEPGELSIGDFHWTTLEGRDAILNYIFRHADQIVKINILINSRTDDYYHWLTNIHTPKLKSSIFNMARIIDVKSSFEDIRVYSSGSLVLKVIDPLFKWNNGVFKFFEENGVLKVQETEESAKTTLTIEGLTSILYGTLDIPQLRRLGWLKGDAFDFTVTKVSDEDGTVYRGIVNLDDWFPRANPWLTEDF